MSNIFNLKEWLTLEESAKHLSTLLSEEIHISDIYRLALDGHLILSVYFVNHSKARCGKVIPLDEVEKVELPTITRNILESLEITEYDELVTLGLPFKDEYVLVMNEKVISIDGVWDLSMQGSERLDIEHEFQRLIGGPEITLTDIDGALVSNESGRICQLMESFDQNPYQKGSLAQLKNIKKTMADAWKMGSKEEKKLLDEHQKDREKYLAKRAVKKLENDYYPSNLPEDCLIVVKTHEIQNFLNSLNVKSSSEKENTSIQFKRELVLSGWLAGKNIDAAIPLEQTRADVWKALSVADSRIFPPTSPDTIKDFFSAQKLCKFKTGRRKGQ